MSDPMVQLAPEYLAESKATLLYAFFSIPIPLEVFSTAFRLWVKGRNNKGVLAFDDVLMLVATVLLSPCLRVHTHTLTEWTYSHSTRHFSKCMHERRACIKLTFAVDRLHRLASAYLVSFVRCCPLPLDVFLTASNTA